MNRETGDRAEKPIGWLIAKAAAALNLRLSRSFAEAGIPLSPEQYGVLASVARGKGMSQADVARALKRDGPSVTRLVDALEREGCIERERMEGDRRAYSLVATEKGKDALSSAERIVEKEERFLRECLPSAAVSAISSSMARIMSACEGDRR